MPNIRTRFLMAVALLLINAVCAAAERKATPKRAPAPAAPLERERKKLLATHPLVLGYYIEDARALSSVKENAAQITVLAPQSYVLEADGVVRGAVPSQLAALAERHRLPVMPLIVNSDFDRKAVSTILRSPKLQERTASYMASLARRGNFVGWQLDFEHIDPADAGTDNDAALERVLLLERYPAVFDRLRSRAERVLAGAKPRDRHGPGAEAWVRSGRAAREGSHREKRDRPRARSGEGAPHRPRAERRSGSAGDDRVGSPGGTAEVRALRPGAVEPLNPDTGRRILQSCA